jgi:hypothetical protein
MTRRMIWPVMGLATMLGAVPAAADAQQSAAAPAARGTGEPPAPTTCGPRPGAANIAENARCFELRTYRVTGKAGDINLLHARFRQHSMRILRKHGMDIMGFWQQADRPDTLMYLVAYKDAATREAAWAAFQSDPEWAKVAKAMDVSLTVESTYMVATDYAPMK